MKKCGSVIQNQKKTEKFKKTNKHRTTLNNRNYTAYSIFLSCKKKKTEQANVFSCN